MSALTLIAILFALPVFSWTVWFLIELIRYIVSGEYEVDKRLRNIGR